MIHTFELSKEIIDVKDDDGNTISRETIFSSLINTLDFTEMKNVSFMVQLSMPISGSQ